MTTAHLTAIVTGLLYIGAGMALAVVVRLLGPTYHTKVTGPFWLILMFALGALGLLWRGVTILFPGRLVDISGMSLVAPVTALIVAGLCLFILDFVMGDRSPPPLFHRYCSWAIRHHVPDSEVMDMAFALNPAMHQAAPEGAQINRTGRRTRLVVLTASAATILTVLGVIAASAGG